MEKKIGLNIQKMQAMINTPVIPPPHWIPKWQIESEHLLFLSHMAKDVGDMEKLLELDAEAERMVTLRETKMASGQHQGTIS